jgi:hypothetical protein
MGMGGQRHAPAALPHQKNPVPIVQKAGWASAPVWMGVENFTPIATRSQDHAAHSESLHRLRYPGAVKVSEI